MTEYTTITHERVDDIPLILGVMNDLRLPEIVDTHLGNHGNQRGLSTGWVMTIWLAFIISAGDHRKSTVREWVTRHRTTLERLTDQSLRPDGVDFTDDHVGIVLHRLSATDAWNALEETLWQSLVTVSSLPVEGIHVDSTTTCGYHTVSESGLMQYGHSKDHRPDLPQLKMMAATAQPTGMLVAMDVVAGNHADDSLYLPLIDRVRPLVGTGMLSSGDAKMAALGIRANLVAHTDCYLMPVPMTGALPADAAQWIDAVVLGEQEVAVVCDGPTILGAGYEVQRRQPARVADRDVTWEERLLVVRSQSLAHAQMRSLTRRLDHAHAAVEGIDTTPRSGTSRSSG